MMILAIAAYLLGLTGIVVITNGLTRFLLRLLSGARPKLKPVYRRVVRGKKPVFGERVFGMPVLD